MKLNTLDPQSFVVENSKLISVSVPGNTIFELNINVFASLMHLQFIDLSSNKLTIIEKSQFKNNTKLYFLDLQNNILKYFNLNFKNFPHLRFLYLQNNELTILKEDNFGYYLDNSPILKQKQNLSLLIYHNKLNCNCSMHWIRELKYVISIITKPYEICTNYNYTDIINDKRTIKTLSLSCFLEKSVYCPTFEILNC